MLRERNMFSRNMLRERAERLTPTEASWREVR